MTEAVVLVGPVAIHGPGVVGAEPATVALDCIDDELALLDDEVIPVEELWRNVIRAAMGDACDDVVLVCPSWWSKPRVDLVEAAGREWSESVTVLRRAEVLAARAPSVVEVAPDLVVVRANAQRFALSRAGAPDEALDAVANHLAGLDATVVDIPTGTEWFGGELYHGLRCRGFEVTRADDQTLLRTLRGAEAAPSSSWNVPISSRAAVLGAALLSITALVAAGVGHGVDSADGDVTWLVEGRVAVEVPVDWTVERVTSGPGSARVQVISPPDEDAILHVTQSRVPEQQTLDVTADALRTALDGQPRGVFVEFVALDRRAGRPVVSYREIRADRDVAWTVLLDRGVRIAIGCQGPRDRRGSDPACEHAVRSAHAVAPK